MSLGEATRNLAGAGVAGATSQHQDRATGSAENASPLGEGLAIGPGARNSMKAGREHSLGEVVDLGLHILGQRQDHRPDVGRIGQDSGDLGQRLEKLLGAADPVEIAGHGPEGVVDARGRAAEICQRAGFDTVLHYHAGTYIETADEIHRVMDAIDPSLLGLCLDTGHARFGGADPVELANTYKDLIRHVHIKDCKVDIMDDVKREGKGLEEALARGVFCELGEGDSGIGEVIATLKSNGYAGWLVVEQDRFLRQTDTLETLFQSNVRNREYLTALGI
jgi:sugar phosphate isomerase/epimerase